MASIPTDIDYISEQNNIISQRTGIEQKRVICIVPHCKEKSATSGLRFFKLPQDIERQNTWLNCIGVTREHLKTKQNFVCEKHFSPNNIGYSRLTRNALPCVNIALPDNGLFSNANPFNILPIGQESEKSEREKCDESITSQTHTDKDIEFLKLINGVICSHCDNDKDIIECNGCSKKSIQLNLYKKQLKVLQHKIKLLKSAYMKCKKNARVWKVKYNKTKNPVLKILI